MADLLELGETVYKIAPLISPTIMTVLQEPNPLCFKSLEFLCSMRHGDRRIEFLFEDWRVGLNCEKCLAPVGIGYDFEWFQLLGDPFGI